MFFLPKLFYPLVIKCGKLKIPYKRRCITLGEPSNQMGDFPARRVWLEGIKREGFGAIGLHIPYKMICLWGAFRNRSTNRFQFVDICGFWMVVLRYLVLMLFLRWPEKCFPSVMFSDTFGMAETPIRLISDSIDGRFQPPSHFFFGLGQARESPISVDEIDDYATFFLKSGKPPLASHGDAGCRWLPPAISQDGNLLPPEAGNWTWLLMT